MNDARVCFCHHDRFPVFRRPFSSPENKVETVEPRHPPTASTSNARGGQSAEINFPSWKDTNGKGHTHRNGPGTPHAAPAAPPAASRTA